MIITWHGCVKFLENQDMTRPGYQWSILGLVTNIFPTYYYIYHLCYECVKKKHSFVSLVIQHIINVSYHNDNEVSRTHLRSIGEAFVKIFLQRIKSY